jgi:hypothetical protein
MCVCVCEAMLCESKLHMDPEEVLLRDHYMCDNPLDKLQ